MPQRFRIRALTIAVVAALLATPPTYAQGITQG
jgi:hypothetical protein